jgi:cytoskeleton protein RodZ
MNLLEVGTLLKRERERRGISIRDVMDSTKISRRNLTALEEGQVTSLPHPVYLKGYVRNIAKMVGLDADELALVVDLQYDPEAARYLPQAAAAAPVHPAPAPDSPAQAAQSRPGHQPTPPVAHNAPEPERGSSLRFTSERPTAPKRKADGNVGSVIALVLLVALLIGLLVHYQRVYIDAPPPPPVPAPQLLQSDDNATALNNATEALDNATEAWPQAEPVSTSMPVAPTAQEPARVPAPVAPAAPGVPVTSIEVTRKAPVAEGRTPGLQQLTITAKAGESCWIHVNDGQQTKNFTLQNGETRQVEFAGRLRLRLGNAGGVTFRLNGQEHPFEGKRGSIETVEFGAR